MFTAQAPQLRPLAPVSECHCPFHRDQKKHHFHVLRQGRPSNFSLRHREQDSCRIRIRPMSSSSQLHLLGLNRVEDFLGLLPLRGLLACAAAAVVAFHVPCIVGKQVDRQCLSLFFLKMNKRRGFRARSTKGIASESSHHKPNNA